jgi:hypothetical protein
MTLQRGPGVRYGAPVDQIELSHGMTRAFLRCNMVVPSWYTSCSSLQHSPSRQRRNVVGHAGPRTLE